MLTPCLHACERATLAVKAAFVLTIGGYIYLRNMKQIKESKLFIVVLSLTLMFVFTFGTAYADPTESELRDDLTDVKQEQKEVSQDLAAVAAKITTLQSEYNDVNYQVAVATKEINKLEKEITDTKKELQERETNLNARLVAMYKNGSIGFVDVLLGSSSISDFVSNIEMIRRIYENDVNVMQLLKTEQSRLEDKKESLESKKINLKEKQQELVTKKAELDKEKQILNDKEDELKKEADQLKYEIVQLMSKNSQYVGGAMAWPCPASHYITSSFGNRLHPITKTYKFHTGIDIGASTGCAVIAAQAGRVIMATWYSGYGNCVMLDHGGGIVTLYGHLSKISCSNGDTVSAGQTIGLVGSTGNSTGPHLHFEVRKNGEYINPMQYF